MRQLRLRLRADLQEHSAPVLRNRGVFSFAVHTMQNGAFGSVTGIPGQGRAKFSELEAKRVEKDESICYIYKNHQISDSRFCMECLSLYREGEPDEDIP